MTTSDLDHLKSLFHGTFLVEPITLQEKLMKVKAFVFDWDGVFNNGTKDASGSSPFNEVDSMGINMLRFNHFLWKGKIPFTAVITGELNTAAFTFARREHFHGVYYSVKNKKEALLHLCERHGIEPHEVAFFYDDVLDLSVAELVGLRIMIGRPGSPLLSTFAQRNKLVDYITAMDGSRNAIREASELLMGLSGKYDETITQRVNYTDTYHQYITNRNAFEPSFYTLTYSEITEQQPK